jgi:acylphosphatase
VRGVIVRRRVVVEGRVQGVWFRESCRHVAQSAGVGGWVSNRNDGNVEACFEGEDDAVARLVAWCRVGPSHAVVTGVTVSEEEPVGEHAFRVS